MKPKIMIVNVYMSEPQIRIRDSNGEQYIVSNGVQKLQKMLDEQGFTRHLEKGQKIYRAIIN